MRSRNSKKEQFRNVYLIHNLCGTYQKECSDSGTVIQIIIKSPQENAIYALIHLMYFVFTFDCRGGGG